MINKHILQRYGPRAREWLSGTIEGQLFYNKFLNVKGLGCFLIGMPDSGKTRKMHWLVTFLKELETIVWIDSCKDEEIGPLFKMGKPVNIIIPSGMRMDIRNLGEDYKIQSAFMPDQFWDLIEPGAINIIAVKQFFFNPKELSRFYSALFRSLIIRASEEFFRDKLKIERMTVLVDEAQRIVPSQSMTSDREAIETGQIVTSNVLESRAYGIRIIVGTQDNQSMNGIARRQIPTRIFCHGSSVRSDESKKMHRLAEYSENYAKHQGLVVFSDGDYFPKTGPWDFPDFPKPEGARIRYIGKVDRPDLKEDEENEMIVDLGVHSAAAIPPDDDGLMIPHVTSYGGISS